MWRPYFASAAWEPYSNGSWAWYPGAGYSWVSPYPWAWTPYHSGSWGYCDNVGWGWMPGGGWNGLNNVAGLAPAQSTLTGGPIRAPHMPVQPPLPRGASLIPVNTKPIAASEIASPTSFVFRKDSAGLGVPRETLGHLNKFSNESISRGSATTSVYTSVPQTGRADGRLTMSQSLATSVHRGYAPSTSTTSRDSYSSSFSGSSSGGGSSSNTRVTSTSTTSTASSGGGVKR